ncbi:MAG: acetyl-CoA carboxylase biotin carboxyl carrier protein subunit [Chlorobiaceae bacterium]|nr:acetyl-CoA carboxylase biotin carboxyl carrier protein subunit [Chlorobiaceae bacterium]
MQLTLTIDGKKYIVDVDVVEGEEVRMPPTTPSATPATIRSGQTVEQAPRQQAAPPVSDGLPDDKVCRSPISGIVQRINVQPGQQLQVNDLLVVLEAMKMETNITAHVDGKVKRIIASVGEAVKSGQPLIEFE